jgi:hypothetical protein
MLIDQFNKTIDDWILSLDQYSFDELLIKPGPESWSLGQVYIHLVNETRYYISQVEECLKTNDHAAEKMKGEGVTMLSNNTFPNARIRGEPDSIAKIQQPTSQWQLKLEMEGLKTAMNKLWNRMIQQPTVGKTMHPGLGYFNAEEWFQFAEMHLRHHFRQKNRIDEKIRG